MRYRSQQCYPRSLECVHQELAKSLLLAVKIQYRSLETTGVGMEMENISRNDDGRMLNPNSSYAHERCDANDDGPSVSCDVLSKDTYGSGALPWV
jgi:hypothetical protein